MAIKETIPFNFDDLYASLEAQFAEKGYDSMYEGSNTAQLITAMTYLTSMLNTNTAVNINEMLLPLARKRNNVFNDARLLGYEPVHITSYQYKLTLSYANGATVAIPKYTKFTQNGNTYYYLGDDINEIAGVDYTIIINVKEGNLLKYTDYSDTLSHITGSVTNSNGEVVPQYYIDVPHQNIEDDGLEVYLIYIDEEGNRVPSDETNVVGERWYKSEQFMIDKDSSLEKEFVRLDNIKFKTPRVYFTLAGVGEGIRSGTNVNINALVSKGADGVMNAIPTTTLDAEILSFRLNIKGDSEESIESIKTNAPLFFNSGNRAVTKVDYIAICSRQNTVDSTAVWGGDDEYPKVPGHIWFSFTPQILDRVFSNDDFKNNFDLVQTIESEDLENWYVQDPEIFGDVDTDGIFGVLDTYKIPTLEFHNRHPLYVDFDIDISIMKYDLGTSKSDVNQIIFDIINNYFQGIDEDGPVEFFEYEYFHSNLMKRVDQGLSDATGFENTLTTSIVLNSKTLNQEDDVNVDNLDINIPLSVPFEDYFDGAGDLQSTLVPNIDTLNFAGTGKNLTVDWSGLTGGENGNPLITANVLLDAEVIGEYVIFNDYRKYIIIKLYVNGANALGTTATGVYNNSLYKSFFDTTQKLNLVYASPNIQFAKNCLPRLKSVTFN